MKQRVWGTVADERENLEKHSIGRVVVGEYGKDFTLDEDGNEVKKPKLVRGRGRPKADADVIEYLFSDELQAIQDGWNSQKNQEVTN
jgi:hypothetical protein